MRRIIIAAREGKSILEFPVYDGSDTGEKLYNTLTTLLSTTVSRLWSRYICWPRWLAKTRARFEPSWINFCQIKAPCVPRSIKFLMPCPALAIL